MNAITVEIAKLELKAGDVLAVTTEQILHVEQRKHLNAILQAAMPEGVKTVILDGGVKLTKLATGGPVPAGRPYLVGENMSIDSVGIDGCKGAVSTTITNRGFSNDEILKHFSVPK